jgi:cell fate regulator YaaT (PSP1 superfamily)
MKNIVGIRFRKPGKVYFFDPGYIRLNPKDKVIVETSLGEDIGEVVISKRELPDEKVSKDLKRIIRLASSKDIKRQEDNKQKEKKAMEVCKEQIKKHKLEMNLVDVEYKFDGSKIIFYFTADGRVDFRELVKDLAATYKTRIELRQIGVRDEVRKIGGNGVCGRELCCCSFLNNFDIVSIKMAKEQSASLNPSKISGNCGRLMCCLKYEQGVYEEKIKKLPKVGSIVKTEDGEGTIVSEEVLKERVKVQFKKDDVTTYKSYDAKDVKVIKAPTSKVEEENSEEIENIKELKKLEALEKQDKKTREQNQGEDY